MIRPTLILAMLFLPALATGAEPAERRPQIGDTYQITSARESVQRGNTGSQSSSTDRDSIIERVIGVRETGLELEYDLPGNGRAGGDGGNWQFPVRVFKPNRGPLQLLNEPELAARVDGWLRSGGMTRAACGHWIFTWNAFRIECDPQSAIKIIEGFDITPDDLRDGAPYKDPAARTAAALTRKAAGPNGATYTVEMAIDPEVRRRARAESDIVIAEIGGKTLALETTLRARSAEAISGTITITFETDSAGEVRRRTRVTQLEIKGPGQRIETATETETIERRRVAKPTPDWRRTA